MEDDAFESNIDQGEQASIVLVAGKKDRPQRQGRTENELKCGDGLFRHNV